MKYGVGTMTCTIQEIVKISRCVPEGGNHDT